MGRNHILETYFEVFTHIQESQDTGLLMFSGYFSIIANIGRVFEKNREKLVSKYTSKSYKMRMRKQYVIKC